MKGFVEVLMGFCCNKWNEISISVNSVVFHKFIFSKMDPQIVLLFLNLHTVSFNVLIMLHVQIKMHKTEFAFLFFVSMKLGLLCCGMNINWGYWVDCRREYLDLRGQSLQEVRKYCVLIRNLMVCTPCQMLLVWWN